MSTLDLQNVRFQTPQMPTRVFDYNVEEASGIKEDGFWLQGYSFQFLQTYTIFKEG